MQGTVQHIVSSHEHLHIISQRRGFLNPGIDEALTGKQQIVAERVGR